VESGKHLVIFQEASGRKWNSHPILFPFCQTYTQKKGFHNHQTGPKVLFGSKPFLPSPDPDKKKKKLPCSTHQPTDAMKISLANFSNISALGGSAGITAVSVP